MHSPHLRNNPDEPTPNVTTPVSVSEPCDKTFLGASNQVIGLGYAGRLTAEELKPFVMSSVLECSKESTVACGYVTKSLRVTSGVSYCSILKDEMVETARAKLDRVEIPSDKHPETDDLRKKLKELDHELLVQMVLDTLMEKEGDAISYLQTLALKLNSGSLRLDLNNLISTIKRISQEVSKKQGPKIRF